MATGQTCSATQDGPYRLILMQVWFPDGAECSIRVRYTWDGTSTWPTCDGPVQDVRVLNTSATYSGLIRLPNRRRGTTSIVVSPGTDQLVSGGQLNSFGIELASDTEGIGLSTNTAL